MVGWRRICPGLELPSTKNLSKRRHHLGHNLQPHRPLCEPTPKKTRFLQTPWWTKIRSTQTLAQTIIPECDPLKLSVLTTHGLFFTSPSPTSCSPNLPEH